MDKQYQEVLSSMLRSYQTMASNKNIKGEGQTKIQSSTSTETSSTSQQPYGQYHDQYQQHSRDKEEQQHHAINRALDETKDNIRKTTDEARSQIPRYTQAVNDYQEQTIQASREIADNYLDSQKEIINSSSQHGFLRLRMQTEYFGQIGCLQDRLLNYMQILSAVLLIT